jgi:hypothetical protein
MIALAIASAIGLSCKFWQRNIHPLCKDTEPRVCAEVADRLLHEEKIGEAVPYLALAALRESGTILAKTRFEQTATGNIPNIVALKTSLTTACDKKDELACFTLDVIELRKPSVHAIAYLEGACAANDFAACSLLGECFKKGKWDSDEKEERAKELFKKACDGGDMLGCSNLGWCYQYGNYGLAKDEKRAVELYKRACDGREMAGCDALGSCYFYGDCGLAKDEKRAGELFKRACDGGEMRGCGGLGICYSTGVCGLEQDLKRACELYRQACDGGVEIGCSLLGLCR